jgi:hypothetical protein
VNERRKFKRRLLVYNLEVFESESNEPMGRVVDITPEGMMLVRAQPIDINSVLHLSVELPSEIFSARRVNFTAIARWCRHDINPDLFDIGLEFTDITDKNIETIIGLIADYAFPD